MNKQLYIALSLLSLTANAQTVSYTLDECISEALANNLRLKTAENNVEAAEMDKQNAFTHYFPNVSASGGAYFANKDIVSLSVDILGMSFAKGALSEAKAGAITATQPLFAGGQIVNSNRLASVGVEVAKLQLRQNEDEVKTMTEKYFWKIFMLKSKLSTLDAVDDQIAIIERDVLNAINAGVANNNDILQVRLKKNQIKNSRITVENELNTALALLAQQIGHPADSIDINFSLAETIPAGPADLQCNHSNALEQTTEYALMEQNIKAHELQKKLSVGKNLPTVAIGGSLVAQNLEGLGKDHYALGFATVSIPLTDWWGGSRDIKKRKLNKENAQITFEDNSQKLVIKMNNLYNALALAYEQVLIAQESIDQATENLRLQKDYYNAGTSTMSNLLEAQTLFSQAHDSYSESYAMYEIKRREYLNATGR